MSTIAEPAGQESGQSVRWALASLSLSMLLSSLGTSIANVGLPAFADAFGASFQQVQWIVIAYLLASTTLIVTVGRLGDRIGSRRLLLIGVVLFSVASAMCGAAPTLGLLIAARAIQGVGAAIMMALSMALVGEAVPKDKAGLAMGLLGTMSAIGTALGPSLGGMLIAGFGWPAIFLVKLPIGLIAFVLARRFLPVDRRDSYMARGFDTAGMLLLAMTLAAYTLAMTLGRGSFGAINMGLLAAAAFGLAFLVVLETRVAFPLIPLTAVRDPALAASLVMSALVSTVMMTTLVVGPFYLSRGLGLDTALVGLVLSIGPVCAALTGVPAGRAVDRFGAGRMTVAGLFGMASGALILAITPVRFGIAGYVVPILIVTFGYALFQAANNTAAMSDVPADQRGVISGLLNLARNLGLISGASVMGAIFAFGSGASDVAGARPEDVAAGLRVTFGVAAAMLLAGLGIGIVSRRPRLGG